MSIEILKEIPSKASLGETTKFSKFLSDFSAADGWVLTYYFINAVTDSKFSVQAATYELSGFLVTLNPAVFDSAAAGDFRYEAYVELSGEKSRVDFGDIELLADLTSESVTELDTRSDAKKTFDAIVATMQGRATSDQEEMRIRDRGIKRMGGDELREWYSFFKKIVDQETAAENIEKGKGSGNKILATFRKTT